MQEHNKKINNYALQQNYADLIKTLCLLAKTIKNLKINRKKTEIGLL